MANAREMLDDVDNVGIMQGFLDEMGDEMEEDEDGEEENSAAKMLDRRPDSPEILMNNLRGDMRSVDARREELADLVGYAAAAETPDSVLAMLQPVLAQGSGLGALPQSAPMAQGPQAPMPPGPQMPPPPGPMAPSLPAGAPVVPPEAMMPPPSQDGGIAALLAGGAPGGGQAPPQAPIGMKKGGYVQHFRLGSDEEAVAPAGEDETASDEEDSSSGMQVTPDMLALARQGYMNLLTSKAAPKQDLRTLTAEREKLYQELLGEDKDMRQAQLLLMLGQKGLQLAGNVDAQGRPLRGSTMSRLATVASEVPGAVSQFISDADKRQNAIRMAAIQAAEKEIQQGREAELARVESTRKAFGDILRSAKAGTGADFGKGGMGPHWNYVTQRGITDAFVNGLLDPDAANRYAASASVILADARPKTERYTDDQGYLRTREIPGYSEGVAWLQDALAKGMPKYGPGAAPRAQPPSSTVPITPDSDLPARDDVPPPVTSTAPGAVPAGTVSEGERSFAEPTLWESVEAGIGIVPAITSTLARNVPVDLAGEIGRRQQQARENIKKIAPRVNIALRETTRLSNAEREDIKFYLGLDPRAFENMEGYYNNVISMGQLLYSLRNDAIDKAADQTLVKADADNYRLKAREIEGIIKLVGIPPVIGSREDYLRVPIGNPILTWNEEQEAWVRDVRKKLPGE